MPHSNQKLLQKSTLFKILPLLLTIIFLVFYLTPLLKPTNFPGNPGDVYYYAWATDWFCPKFFHSDLTTTQVFYPHGVNLSGGYHAPLLYSLTCFLPAKDPLILTKALYLIQIISLFLVNSWIARKLFHNQWLQFSFVFIYSFSGFYLHHLPQHIDLVSTLWTTPLVFYFANKLNFNSAKSILSLTITLAISFVSAWQNIPNLTLLTLILAIRQFRINKPPKTKKLIKTLYPGIIAFTTIFIPFSWPMLTYHFKQTSTLPIHNTLNYESNIYNYLIPTNQAKSIFDDLRQSIASNVSPLETHNPLDLFIIILGIHFLIQGIQSKQFQPKPYLITLSVIYFLLSFGTNLSFTGNPTLPLPYYSLLSQIPPFNFTRTPGRYSVVVIFFFTYLVLRHLDRQIQHSHKPTKLPLILAGYSFLVTTFFAHNTTVPTHQLADYFPISTLNQISQDNSNQPILNLPLAIGLDQSPNLAQLIHRKPLLNGYVSHAVQTPNSVTTFTQNPTLGQLECQNTPYTFTTDTHPHTSEEFVINLTQNHVKYLIVNQPFLDLPNCAKVKDLLSTYLNHSQIKSIGGNQYFTVYQLNSAS